MTMRFGRYNGRPLDELPPHYLRWLLGPDLREPLRSAVRAEAAREGRAGERSRCDDPRPPRRGARDGSRVPLLRHLEECMETDVLGQATFGSGGGIEWYRPDGIYLVDLVALTTQTSRNKFRDNELQTQLLWEFRPAGYDGPGTLRWWTSFSTHEKSKLPETCTALGVPIPTPEHPEIRRDQFVGRRCLARIQRKPGAKNPRVHFPQIVQLLPEQQLTVNGSAPAVSTAPDPDIPF